MRHIEETIKSLLRSAGIEINEPGEADLQVHNPGLYKRVMQTGSMGLGESYMDGWWEVKKLDDFFYHILAAELDEKVKSWRVFPDFLAAVVFNACRRSKAFEIGERHYDLGNDLFRGMLDKRMMYSCGYWKEAQNLDDAQLAKLDLICKKLYLKPGMKVLDIGCGWGGFCKYAAENYEVDVYGITVSKEQVLLGNEQCKGLRVKILLQDYRELDAEALLGAGNLFDRIVSVGMIEHVGYKNFRTFMKTVHRALRENGLFLLHTIGSNKSVLLTDPWVDRYIFPNSMLPSIKQLGDSFENLFVMEDWHSFGHYYDKTLMAWYENFQQSWPNLKSKYDERFYRMWKYYLLSCAGSFRASKDQLWQIVLSKNGVREGYQSIR
ncbi:MAG: cyclopropane fatty acyl phospholipid synthase [Bacteroidales bacterium]|jgi:cyclopropane-fatty-acyl-phospholipid synthase